MKTNPTCSSCGKPLQANLAGGLCSACALQLALDRQETSQSCDAPGDSDAASQTGIPTIRRSAADVPHPGDAGQIGPYKLLQKIGEGGFGVVYMAEQQTPIVRRVALKIIKSGMDTKQVVARFEAERQALALMDHPNIAKVLDAGETEHGRPYFVMELVRGVSITDYCDRHKLGTEARLRLFVAVCQAVQHAHQKGVIHRDLKPSNVMVTLLDGAPLPKVIDFGIAKATQHRLTEKTLFTEYAQMIGTPAYMSPEQAEMNALDIDTRSDIYSLGVLLYELLTGFKPFEERELLRAGYDELRRVIREVDPPKPSTRLSSLSAEQSALVCASRNVDPECLKRRLHGDLDWIIMRALEKNRSRRFETAGSMATDILRHLRGEAVESAPPSLAYRLGRFSHKHRWALGTAAAITASLVAGLAVSIWLLFQANQARQQTEAARSQLAEQRGALADTLDQLELKRAEDFFERADGAVGIAHLTRVARRSPSNRVAAARLAFALMERGFCPPLGTVVHDDEVLSARFSPDGTKVLSFSKDGTARVWIARTGQVLAVLRHEAEVRSARFSPDGRRVVTASLDNTAQVWDAETGRTVGQPLRHDDWVVSANFSPDGRSVVTTSVDQSARIWNAEDGTPVGNPLSLDGRNGDAVYSPGGEWLLVSSGGAARLWNPGTGEPVGGPFKAQDLIGDGALVAARFDPQGRRVVTANLTWSRGRASVWDLQTGQTIGNPIPYHSHNAWSVDFSPDGERLLLVSGSTNASVWDIQSGQEVAGPLAHEANIYSAQFSPDGRWAVTASLDRTARVWDATTGQLAREPIRHGALISSARFSPDGRWVVTASSDHTATVWDLQDAAAPLELRHEQRVTAARFSPDGRSVVAGHHDGTLQTWDARTGRPVHDPHRPNAGVRLAELSDGARWVVSLSTNGEAQIWDVPNRRPRSPAFRGRNKISSARLSPDGSRVATSTGTICQFWDALTGQRLNSPLAHPKPVKSLRFSSDGQQLVTTCLDGIARIWNARTGQLVSELLADGDNLRVAQLSPDGQWVATGSSGGTGQIWNASSGEPAHAPLLHDAYIHAVEFSPDGQYLATASRDKTARVWETATGQATAEPLRHAGEVRSIGFSPDGRWIVTTAADNTARIWDVRTGLAVSDRLPHDSPLQSATFSPDGRQLLTVAGDTLRLWTMPTDLVPIPAWFPEFAETYVGVRFNSRGSVELAPRVAKFEQALSVRLHPDSVYSRLAAWLLDEESRRSAGFPGAEGG